jgi:hypothetical protein
MMLFSAAQKKAGGKVIARVSRENARKFEQKDRPGRAVRAPPSGI